MPGQISLRPIVPKRPDVTALRNWPRVALQEYSSLAANLFEQSAHTWKPEDQPEVAVAIRQEGQERIIAYIVVEGRVYRFVSEGTDVRYATMSVDFAPKTQPGKIVAGRGSGRLRYVSRQVARPGIKARKFDAEIARRTAKDFKQIAERHLRQAVQESGHAL